MWNILNMMPFLIPLIPRN